jgi:glycosyltransferase involved in cell wall biosynthesis/GT2 family glycosyltransferase
MHAQYVVRRKKVPFKEEEEKFTWTPPTNEEIKETQKAIFEPDAQKSGIDPDLTEELRSKIDDAVGNLVPDKGWGIIAHSNEKVYDTIKAITATARGKVDIIIPVYNGIHIVKRCVEAVINRTSWPYHIYIVDDASDQFTQDELHRLGKEYQKHVTVITNTKNRGFAATVNRGIKQGDGEYVCLLNSDVLVTPMWLTKMMMAHKADPRNQIVCPATNNTAVVQIPLSPGASYLQMNRIFEQFAVRRYPEIMPTGFCFFFPRSLIDKIGYFDEGFENFGEESDFWMKTLHYVDGSSYPRYRAVMADDTYIFHERGTSFSQLGADTHMHLRKLASGRFNDLWPQFHSWSKTYNVNRALGHLRDDVPATLVNMGSKYNICWVVHATNMCGGMKYIADIVNEINERGGNARVALIKRTPQTDESFIGELRTAPVIFEGYEDFTTNFPHKVFKNGVVVAATAELVGCVKTLTESYPTIKPMLHVQSYELEMLSQDQQPELLTLVKHAFKAFPDVISNSRWITKTLEEDLGVKPFMTIPPGVDRNLFYPRGRKNGNERPTVMIPLIKSMPCKGYDRGLALIQDIERQAKEQNLEVRIMVYGVKNIPMVSSAICLGPLSQTRIATLLGTEVDVFVDPSSLHSYGLPALEAIASDVAVVSWDNKGIKEYANDTQVRLFDSGAHPAAVAEGVLDLLSDKEKREAQIKKARKSLGKHNRDESVRRVIEAIEKQMYLSISPRRIVMVVPHLRKHGGPTTMVEIANELAKHGHNVSITTVYTDINPEVAETTDLEISVDPQSIPKCDLLITNSDNPMSDALSKLPHVKKKIMLKLSHNERFKQLEEMGLNCDWDAVVTSTEWLKNICKLPPEGWNYKSTQASRVGWWHYGHERMASNPKSREYGIGNADRPLIIGTLIHQHPLKGTTDAVKALGAVFRDYGTAVRFVGVGEIPPKKFGINLPNFNYKHAPNRDQMAEILGSCDVWLGASHTEGLGRMALEAMSAGAACVLSDTGAEFTKNGENCVLYPAGDLAAMVEALRSVLTNKDFAKKIREEGFKTARALADPGPCVDALEKIIEELFNG